MTIVHHHHLVAVHDGVQSVGDRHHSAVHKLLSYGHLDQLVCFQVQRSNCLVKDEATWEVFKPPARPRYGWKITITT